MKSSDERIIRITFLFSLLAHCMFLGIHGFNFDRPQPEKPKQISIQIEIEKPPLLPKIDVMGEEKKLKEVVKKKLPEPEVKPEPEPNLENEKIVEETKPEKKIEEIKIEKPKPELSKEIVEVKNPQDEAMLRYQDMIKQRIESCRRYPNWAKKQGFNGTVHLAFIVLSNGDAQNIKILQSSAFDILDNEAVSTVKRATPFPPIPQDLNSSYLKMEVAVVFKLK